MNMCNDCTVRVTVPQSTHKALCQLAHERCLQCGPPVTVLLGRPCSPIALEVHFQVAKVCLDFVPQLAAAVYMVRDLLHDKTVYH